MLLADGNFLNRSILCVVLSLSPTGNTSAFVWIKDFYIFLFNRMLKYSKH